MRAANSKATLRDRTWLWKLLTPATALMHRLKYPQKFLLISLLFLMPLAPMLYSLVQEINHDIDVARSELAGTQFLCATRQLYEQLIHCRQAVHNYERDPSARAQVDHDRTQVDEQMRQLVDMDHRLGARLKTTDRVTELRKSWEKLSSILAETTFQDSDSGHWQMLLVLRQLIQDVGDSSQLILDPEIETYYLMDAILLKLPEMQQLVAENGLLAGDADRVASAGSPPPGAELRLSPPAKVKLNQFAEQLAANGRALQDGIVRSLGNRFTPELNSPLESAHREFNSTVSELVTQTLNLVSDDKPAPLAKDYAALIADSLVSSFRFWDGIVVELDVLLQGRIDRSQRRLWNAILLAATVFGLVAYLWLGFYAAVTETVRTLEHAAQRMVRGDFDTKLELPTKDEIGSVGSAFNQIASQLRCEWQQARDESKRARSAESALRIAEATYRGIVENAAEGIFQSSPDGRFLSVNPALARIYGYDSPEQLLASVTDIRRQVFVHPEQRDEFERRMNQDGHVKDFEFEVYRRDGAIIWISESARIVRDEQGRVACYEGIVQDITARRRAEQVLRETKDAAEKANLAKGVFLANMSHEIRTPMNAVIGMTGLLLDTDLTDEQREFAQTVRHSAEALLSIINDILDFSKIDAGRLDLEEEPFDLRECLEGAMELLAGRAAEKELEFAYLMDSNTPPTILGDVTRLRQVLSNLLSNAVKFTERGEVVLSVSARQLDSAELPAAVSAEDGKPSNSWFEVKFQVHDTGIGIPAERMDRLFQAFSQVESSTTRRFGGTGLGLAISRRFVEAMGGRMWVESTVGKGTAFCFTIRAAASMQPLPSFDSPDQPQLRGKRVLIVDDNATNRRILQLRAESWGMVPRDTQTPHEALGWIVAGEPFHVALLDIQMPEMDGVALAREIRKYRDEQALPLIACTSLNRREPACDQGLFAAFIQKPLKPSQVYNALLRLLSEQPTVVRHEPAGRQFDVTLGERYPLRILLAEDVAVNQRMMQLILERLGYRTDVAGNGLEVLQALDRQSYDVVLMDIQMPEMDGLAATREIVARFPAGARPRIIALTAHVMRDDREVFRQAGMDDFLAKPVQAKELQAALARAAEALRDAPVVHRGDSARPLPPPGEERCEGDSTSPVLDATALEEFKQMKASGSGDFVDDLLSLFRKEGESFVAAVEQAAQEGNAERLSRAGHKLIGAASSLGAIRLAALASKLEQLARHEQLADAQPLASQLRAEFELAHQSLVAELNAGAGPVECGGPRGYPTSL